MGFIKINKRIAKIIKKYDKYIWQLQLLDTEEFINVFYSQEEDWDYA